MTVNTDSNPTSSLDATTVAAARRVIFLTVFLDILGFGIIIPQLAVYASQFGASPFVTGLLASTYSAMGFLFMPFWGRLSDRIGRRPVLVYSIFGTGLGYILFALAGSLPWLFAARVIDGITGANISTAQAYISDITKPEDRSKVFGLFGAIFGIGFALGPAIGWGLSHLPGAWGGNLGLGAVSAALSFLNWALAVKFLPETLSPSIREENARKDGGKRSYFNSRAFSRALGIPSLNVVIIIGFLATTAFATLQGTYALFIIKEYVRPAVQSEIKANPAAKVLEARELLKSETKHLDISGNEGAGAADDITQPYDKSMGGDFSLNQPAPEGLSWRHVEKALVRPHATRDVGVLFATIGFLSLIIQGGMIRPLQKRMGEVYMVLAGTFIMALGLAFVPFPTKFWGQFAAMAILTLGNGLSTPVLTSLVSQLAPEAERGEITGVYQSLQSLGRIVGPLVGSSLFGAVSSSAPFLAGGLIMMSSFLLAFKLRSANLTPAELYGETEEDVEATAPAGAPLAEA